MRSKAAKLPDEKGIMQKGFIMEALNFDLFDLEAPEDSLALPSLESLGREPRFTSPAALKPIADIPRCNYRIRPEDVLYPAGAGFRRRSIPTGRSSHGSMRNSKRH